jgi:hypothetical protein
MKKDFVPTQEDCVRATFKTTGIFEETFDDEGSSAQFE